MNYLDLEEKLADNLKRIQKILNNEKKMSDDDLVKEVGEILKNNSKNEKSVYVKELYEEIESRIGNKEELKEILEAIDDFDIDKKDKDFLKDKIQRHIDEIEEYEKEVNTGNYGDNFKEKYGDDLVRAFNNLYGVEKRVKKGKSMDKLDQVEMNNEKATYRKFSDEASEYISSRNLDMSVQELYEEMRGIKKSEKEYKYKLDEKKVNGGKLAPSEDFGVGFEKMLKGELDSGKTLSLKKEGIIKKIFGDGFFTLRQRRLKDKMKQHNLTPEDIKGLDKEINNPILVYEGGTEHKAKVIVTNKNKGDKKIAVAVGMDRGEIVSVDDIKSIHPKELQRLINETSSGKVHKIDFEDTKKIQEWIDSVSSIGKQPTTISGILNDYNKNLEKSKLKYKSLSKQEAENIVNKYFGKEVQSKFVRSIRTPEGLEALGRYKDKLIEFAKNPKENVVHHEVFHAYFDLAIPRGQKISILDQIKKEKGIKSDIDAEEFLADSFEDFVINRKYTSGVSAKLKKMIADLVYEFRKFFGKENKIEAIFRDLEALGKGKKEFKKVGDLRIGGERYFVDNLNKTTEEVKAQREKKIKEPEYPKGLEKYTLPKTEKEKKLYDKYKEKLEIFRENEKNNLKISEEKRIRKYGGEYVEGFDFEKMPDKYKKLYENYLSFIKQIEKAKDNKVSIFGNTQILNQAKKLGLKPTESKSWNGFGYSIDDRFLELSEAKKIQKMMKKELDEISDKYVAKINKQGGKSAEELTLEKYKKQYVEKPEETLAEALYNLNKEAKKIRDKRTELKGKIWGSEYDGGANYSSWQLEKAHEKLEDLKFDMGKLYKDKDKYLRKIIEKFKLEPKGYHEFDDGDLLMDYYEFGGRGFHIMENNSKKSLGAINSEISSEKVGKKISLENIYKILDFLDNKELNNSFYGKKDVGENILELNNKPKKGKRGKTLFQTTEPIRELTSKEKIFKENMEKVVKGESQIEGVAIVKGAVAYDGRERQLKFSQRNIKDFEEHGNYNMENFIITVNDYNYLLNNIDGNIDKINFIKKTPNSDNYFVVGANRDNGYYIATHYEVVKNGKESLKTLLGRGKIIEQKD